MVHGSLTKFRKGVSKRSCARDGSGIELSAEECWLNVCMTFYILSTLKEWKPESVTPYFLSKDALRHSKPVHSSILNAICHNYYWTLNGPYK